MDETCLALTAGEGIVVSVCGEPAVDYVNVRNKVISARVPVCAKHKSTHNAGFAKLRTTAQR